MKGADHLRQDANTCVLDRNEEPNSESSGSSFICFGFAYFGLFFCK